MSIVLFGEENKKRRKKAMFSHYRDVNFWPYAHRGHIQFTKVLFV